MQNLEGDTQMDGPEEATQENAWPGATLQPRKAAFPRVFGQEWVRAFVEELYWESTSYIPYKYPCRVTERGHPETGTQGFSLDFLFSKILVISFLAYFGEGEERCIWK